MVHRANFHSLSETIAATRAMGFDEISFLAADVSSPAVSAVMEADGRLRPCVFHPAYERASDDLEGTLNSPAAIEFRKRLDVENNPTCERRVCSLNVSTTRAV